MSEREGLAIIRRIDTDGDAKIGYVEFSDFINYQIAKSYQSSELLYRDTRLRSAERQPRGRELELSESKGQVQEARRKRGQTSEKKAKVTFAHQQKDAVQEPEVKSVEKVKEEEVN